MLHEEILQAMGVELLRPRCVFFHAAEEDIESYNQQYEAIQQDDSIQAKHIQPTATGADARQALLDEMSQLDGYSGTLQMKATALRLKLRLVRLDHYVMLLAQPTLHWREEQSALRFFSDIFYALHERLPQQLQQVVFEWPPAQNYPLNNEKEQAMQLLQSYVQQMLGEQNNSAVLVWGDAIQVLLEQPLSVGTQMMFGAQKVLQLHALEHYWQQPSEKRLLWQHLQVLKAV